MVGNPAVVLGRLEARRQSRQHAYDVFRSPLGFITEDASVDVCHQRRHRMTLFTAATEVAGRAPTFDAA